MAGWSLSVWTGSSASSVTLPSDTTVPAGGAFLVAGPTYSLSSVAAADLTSLPSGAQGIQVDPPSSGGNPTDEVGYPVEGGYYGGSGLPNLSGTPTDQYAFVRSGTQAAPTNTGNNATDFQLVSTDAASFPLTTGGSVQSVLGTPSPLSTTSAQQMNKEFPSSLLDPSAAQSACPNRVVNTNSNPETLTFYRTITNDTSQDITTSSLLFRITSISQQYGPPSTSHAWLTVVPSANQTFTCSAGGPSYTADGLSLNAPATTTGGLGTTLSTTTVTTIAPGGTFTVAFEFDVYQGGSYSVGYDVDAPTS